MPSSPSRLHLSYCDLLQSLRVNGHGHFHRFPEHATQRSDPGDTLLIWVIGGQGYARTQGVECHARGGDLLTFRAGHAHAYRSHADPWDIYWVHFTGDMADTYVSLMRGPDDHPWLHVGLNPAFQDRFEELILTASPRGPGGDKPSVQLRATGIVHDLLAHMILTLERAREGHVPASRHDFDPSPALRLLTGHPDQPMTLAAMARACHLSTSQFSRCFQRHFGLSPMRYVIRRKMAHAASLLTETEMAVKQISLSCGYDDPYYFSRLFRQTMGLSPQKYRQSMRAR